MINSPTPPMDKPHSAIAAPVSALLVIAAALGFFVLHIDPLLLQIAPLDAWPVTAQIMHWVSPWVAMGVGILAASLVFGGLNGIWLQYFTNRQTVITMLVWSLVVVGLTAWAALPLAVQLLAGGI